MSEGYPWYGLTEAGQLEQGDILFHCPHDQVLDDGSVARYWADVVIISQSCDLAHDKLQIIQVCPFMSLETVAGQIPQFEEQQSARRPASRQLARLSLA